VLKKDDRTWVENVFLLETSPFHRDLQGMSVKTVAGLIFTEISFRF